MFTKHDAVYIMQVLNNNEIMLINPKEAISIMLILKERRNTAS